MASVGPATTAIPATIPATPATPAATTTPTGTQLPPLFSTDFTGRGLASQLGLSTPRNQADFEAIFAEIATKLGATNSVVDDNKIVAETDARRTVLADAASYFTTLANIAVEIFKNVLNIAIKGIELKKLEGNIAQLESSRAPLLSQKAGLEADLAAAKGAKKVDTALVANIEAQIANVDAQIAPLDVKIAEQNTLKNAAIASRNFSASEITRLTNLLNAVNTAVIAFTASVLLGGKSDEARDSFAVDNIVSDLDKTLKDAVEDFTNLNDALIEKNFQSEAAAEGTDGIIAANDAALNNDTSVNRAAEAIAAQVAALASLVEGALQELVGPGGIQPQSAFDDPAARVKLAI